MKNFIKKIATCLCISTSLVPYSKSMDFNEIKRDEWLSLVEQPTTHVITVYKKDDGVNIQMKGIHGNYDSLVASPSIPYKSIRDDFGDISWLTNRDEKKFIFKICKFENYSKILLKVNSKYYEIPDMSPLSKFLYNCIAKVCSCGKIKNSEETKIKINLSNMGIEY